MPSSCSQISLWLLYLPYILVFVVVFLLVLFYWFSRRKTLLNKATPPNQPQTNANDTTYGGLDLGYPIRVIVDRLPPSPAPSEKQEAEQPRTEIREHGKFLAEIFTVGLALGLFVVTWSYAKYTFNMWCEMQEQTGIQREAYFNSQRPWISVDVSPVSPLMFNDQGASLMLKFHIKNVGHSVAKYVGIWPYMRFGGVDLGEEEKVCGKIYSPADTSDYGYLIFPDQDFEIPQPAVATKKQVEEAIKGPIPGKVIPYIFVCVDYRDAFEPAHHQTRLVRILVYQDPVTKGVKGAFDPATSTAPIALVPQGHGDSAY